MAYNQRECSDCGGLSFHLLTDESDNTTGVCTKCEKQIYL